MTILTAYIILGLISMFGMLILQIGRIEREKEINILEAVGFTLSFVPLWWMWLIMIMAQNYVLFISKRKCIWCGKLVLNNREGFLQHAHECPSHPLAIELRELKEKHVSDGLHQQ